MECYLTIKNKFCHFFHHGWSCRMLSFSISNNLIKLLSFFFFLIQECVPKYLPGISAPSEKLEQLTNNDAFLTSLWKQLAGSEVLSTYRESSFTFYSSHPACSSHSRCLIGFQSGSVIGSVLTDCEPVDCSLPGSHVHGPWWALSFRIPVDSLGNLTVLKKAFLGEKHC